MNSDGECIAATWELLRISLKKAFRLMAKMNFWFFSYPYRGSPYKTYSKNNLLKIMPAWKDLVMGLFQMDGVKAQLCSQGVMRDIEDFFFDGSNEVERKLQFHEFFLKHSNNFFSLSPHKLEGPNHPECLLSDLLKKLMANGLQSMTTVHDKAYTADQQWVLGDETAVCTAGGEIYRQDASKESFQLALRACAEALVRARVTAIKYKKQRSQLIDEIRNTTDPVAKAAAVCKLTEALLVKSDTQVKRTPAVIGRLLGLCAVHLDESIISDMSKTLEVAPILNTIGLMQTLTKKIFESSSNNLDSSSSSVEDVTAEIVKLNSSPGSDEASIALANLIKSKKSVLMNLPALSTKLLNIRRSSTTTRSLMNTLSSVRVFESFGLNGSSSVEDVTAELFNLNSSPISDNKASVIFNKLIKHKPSPLKELPHLATKLLSMYQARVKKANDKAEKAQLEATKTKDLVYLARALYTYYDIYNLKSVTRDMFEEGKPRNVFDRLLQDYGRDTLMVRLMSLTPNDGAKLWRNVSITAPVGGQIESLGIEVAHDGSQKDVIIDKIVCKGPFSRTTLKVGDKITIINGRRYASFDEGLALLVKGKQEGKITLTVVNGG